MIMNDDQFERHSSLEEASSTPFFIDLVEYAMMMGTTADWKDVEHTIGKGLSSIVKAGRGDEKKEGKYRILNRLGVRLSHFIYSCHAFWGRIS